MLGDLWIRQAEADVHHLCWLSLGLDMALCVAGRVGVIEGDSAIFLLRNVKDLLKNFGKRNQGF